MEKAKYDMLMKYVEQIKKYPSGFEFTINYSEVPTRAKLNGLRFVLDKAKELGYIESISVGISMDDIWGISGLAFSEETFKRR